MPTPLVPNSLWLIIEPLLPCPPPRPKGGRPPVRPGQLSPGSCSCSAPVSPGRCFQRKWGADPASPAGDDCATGKPQACGTGCIANCCADCRCRPDRLEPSLRGQFVYPGEKGGAATGAADNVPFCRGPLR